MAAHSSTTNYRLKLREGDSIQATVTQLGVGEVQIDTTLWSNIESASIVDIDVDAQITVGEDLYATVTNISGNTATLTQERGVYRRNHCPGDSIQMQAIEQVSGSLCRATLEQFRNLETIYIVGVSPGADVTASLAKIRDGIAFALPDTVHDPGLVAGQTLEISTTAGSTTADVTDESGLSVLDQQGAKKFTLELTEPAWATGSVTAEITSTDAEKPQATVVEYPTELPQVGERLTTAVTRSKDYTKVRLNETDLELTIQLSTDAPVSGQAKVKLLDRADGFYQGDIVEYVDPPIKPGETYSARIYAARNQAKIELGDRGIPIAIREDIDTGGDGSIKIVEISDAIYGSPVGDIEPLSVEKNSSTDIDMPDVSKF